MIVGAINSLSVKDAIVRTCLVLAKLNQAIYLILDHYVWFAKIGVLEADSKRLVKLSSRFWLVTLFFNILRNLHDIVTLWAQEVSIKRETVEKDINQNGSVDSVVPRRQNVMANSAYTPTVAKVLLNNPPVLVDTIKTKTCGS